MPQIVRSSGFVRILALIVVALLSATLLACSGATSSSTSLPGATVAPGAASAAADLDLTPDPPADWSGATIELDDLPVEAHDTLALIATDGPYPYDQDGSTFQNREGLLPDRALGFYREFTVKTPRSPDRGARRLVVGDDAATYYTDDHYDSFRFVTP